MNLQTRHTKTIRNILKTVFEILELVNGTVANAKREADDHSKQSNNKHQKF